jgi:hypothetical protein
MDISVTVRFSCDKIELKLGRTIRERALFVGQGNGEGSIPTLYVEVSPASLFFVLSLLVLRRVRPSFVDVFITAMSSASMEIGHKRARRCGRGLFWKEM